MSKMGRDTAKEQALLKFANTFRMDPPAGSLADLTDGIIFSKMLGDLDSRYMPNDLDRHPNPRKWLSKKNNLEIVYKSLLRYVRDECDNLDSVVFESKIDFNAMAEHNDFAETVKFLIIFLMAAVEGPQKGHYIKYITKLDESAQAEIMKIIQEEQEIQSLARAFANKSQTTDEVQQAPSPHNELDKNDDLASEGLMANLHAENRDLKKKNADLLTRFERLQQSHEELLEHSDEADQRLASLEDSRADDDKVQRINKLKADIVELNELIANQEHQAEVDRVAKENYHRELIKLRPMAAQLTECQDQLNVIKAENLTLSKKANTVDHFQKKLEMKADVEKHSERLRMKLETLQSNQQDYDKVFEENNRVKATLTEYSTRFEHQELNIVELSSQKNMLRLEVEELHNQISQWETRRTHDEKFISDLQDQIANAQDPDSPRSASRGLNLEDELKQTADEVNYPLQISRLKAELQLLKSNSAVTVSASVDEVERKRKQIEERFQELFEQNAIANQQLNAIASKVPADKDESVLNTRKLYLETNDALTKVKNELSQAQLDLTERDRDLTNTRADLAAVEQSDLEAIEELKATNEIVHSSLQSDLTVIRGKYKILQTDHEVQKNHLVTALLEKDNLARELTALKAGVDGVMDAKDAEAELAKQKRLQEQIEKKDMQIEELQKKLRKAEESSPDALKAQSETTIKNLTRENALIATAWYDLSSRLQSNHVVLQRRQDAPKSWLGKQRLMVTGGGGGGVGGVRR